MQPNPGVINVAPQLFHSPQQQRQPSPSPPPPPPPLLHSHTEREDSSYHDSTRHTAPLEPLSMPPQLANALEHIVSQLDILTQVSTCIIIVY